MSKKKTEAPEERDADEIIRAARLDEKRLIGDLGDFIISRMKAAGHMKPWDQLTEDEQRAECDAAMEWSRKVVAGVVEGVGKRGLPFAVVGIADKISLNTSSGSAELKCTMPIDKTNFERLQGLSQCVLVFASEELYESAMQTQPEPNQPALVDGERSAADRAEGEVFDAATGELKGEKAEAAAPSM